MLNQNIKITVDAIVFCHNGPVMQVLLVKRKNPPFQGMWSFPGGFVEDDEELETAALRELQEETGLKLASMRQLHTFGKVGRDPRGRTVSVAYYAFIEPEGTEVEADDDAAEAQWVDVKSVTELAFDHMEILELAQQDLGNRMSFLIS